MRLKREDAWPVIVGFLLVMTIGLHLKNIQLRGKGVPSSPVSVQTTPAKQIMSIRQLQAALNEQGHSRYECGIDGKIGPETLEAWSNYICDRYAKKEFDNFQ